MIKARARITIREVVSPAEGNTIPIRQESNRKKPKYRLMICMIGK